MTLSEGGNNIYDDMALINEAHIIDDMMIYNATWAIEVAVTLSEGGNQTAEITSGPDPI